jgi:hypothetical protein
MPGPVPGIHAFAAEQGVDGRDKPGHDVVSVNGYSAFMPLLRMISDHLVSSLPISAA